MFVVAYIVPNFYYRDGIALAIAALVPGFDINGFGWGALLMTATKLIGSSFGPPSSPESRISLGRGETPPRPST